MGDDDGSVVQGYRGGKWKVGVREASTTTQ